MDGKCGSSEYEMITTRNASGWKWMFNWLVSLWVAAVAVAAADRLRSGSASSRTRGWTMAAARVARPPAAPADRWSTSPGFRRIARAASAAEHPSLPSAAAAEAQLIRCSFGPSPYWSSSTNQRIRRIRMKFKPVSAPRQANARLT